MRVGPNENVSQKLDAIEFVLADHGAHIGLLRYGRMVLSEEMGFGPSGIYISSYEFRSAYLISWRALRA